MALNIKKGGRVNLAQSSPTLKVAGIGLGWNPNEKPGGPNFDLDVSAFLLGSDGKIPTDDYLVFYNSTLVHTESGTFDREQTMINNPALLENSRPVSGDNSVFGAVDARTGNEVSGGDDEDMMINFDLVWEGISQIAITVSINKDDPDDPNADLRTHALNFGMVNDCYIRAWDYETGNEIFRYDLNESFSNQDVAEFGRFIRVGNSWEFVATGQGYRGGFETLVDLFRRPES